MSTIKTKVETKETEDGYSIYITTANGKIFRILAVDYFDSIQVTTFDAPCKMKPISPNQISIHAEE